MFRVFRFPSAPTRRLQPVLLPPLASAGLRWCSSGASLSPVVAAVVGCVEKDLLDRKAKSGGQELPLREIQGLLTDDMLDELDIGMPEALAAANRVRLKEYFETAGAAYPLLFQIEDGCVRAASKKQTRGYIMAASGATTPEGLTAIIAERDRAGTSGKSPPAAPTIPVTLSTTPLPQPEPENTAAPGAVVSRSLRALLSVLPPRHVPLEVAAKAWADDGCPGADRVPELGADAITQVTAAALAAGADGALASTTPAGVCDAFRRVVLSAADFVDLVGPWRTPPAAYDAAVREYIAVLPPFVDMADAHAEVTMAEHLVADHDVFRLARYLHTTTYITLASLRTGAVAELLAQDPLHVAASQPQLFDIIPPCDGDELVHLGPMTAETKQGKTVSHVATLFQQDPAASGLPNLAPATPTMTPDLVDPVADHVVDMSQGAVRFLLSEKELTATLGGVPADLEALTVHELQQLLRDLQLCRKAATGNTQRFETQKRFNLRKPIPKGAGLAKYKHKVIRAMLRQRFPRGTVFMDRKVLAHFMFDAMPLDSAVDVLKFRQAHLPEDGRTVFPISSDFICSHSHLWQAVQTSTGTGDWTVQRRDSPNLPPDMTVDDFSEEDIVGIVLTCAPGGDKFDPERPTSFSTVMSRLPELPRQWVKDRHTNLQGLLARHPDHFRIVDAENFCWRSLNVVPPDL